MPSARRSAAVRRWLLGFVVLAAVGAGLALAYLRVSTEEMGRRTAVGTAGSAPTTSGAPAGASPGASPGAAAETTAAETTAGAVDPPARGTAPVTSPPPDDVATDPPVPVPDGAAEVVLTSAGWNAASVVVKAYVAGLVQDGGTCRLTLTRDGVTRSATAAGIADATTTICGRLRVPGDQLDSGVWQAVVSYASDTASGTSRASEVSVP